MATSLCRLMSSSIRHSAHHIFSSPSSCHLGVLPIQGLVNTSSAIRCFSRLNNHLFAAERRFSEKHEWVSVDKSSNSSLGTVGISDYAQESLGEIVYVQLPDVGSSYKASEEVGAVESVKAASEIYSPVSGEVTEINPNLEGKPGLVNTSPYEEGWLYKIKLTDPSEFDKLMIQEDYDKFLKTVKH